MNDNINVNTVYPGTYTPHLDMGSLFEKKKEVAVSDEPGMLVTIDELEDCFRITTAIPGVDLEDISIHVSDNMLAIAVIDHKRNNATKRFEKKEFTTDRQSRNITLPKGADPEFVSAKYQNGILIIHMGKANLVNKQINSNIIAYS